MSFKFVIYNNMINRPTIKVRSDEGEYILRSRHNTVNELKRILNETGKKIGENEYVVEDEKLAKALLVVLKLRKYKHIPLSREVINTVERVI